MTVAPNITPKLTAKIDSARRTAISLTLRANISVSRRPLIMETTVNTSTAIVVVLIPPAVPDGDPPINIKRQHTRAVDLFNPDCEMVQNPAVLVVTD